MFGIGEQENLIFHLLLIEDEAIGGLARRLEQLVLVIRVGKGGLGEAVLAIDEVVDHG